VGCEPDLGGDVIARPIRRHGASLLHLAALAIAVYAASKVLHPRYSRGLNYLVWLVAGAVLHDLVLVPGYALADRLVRSLPRSLVNHVRFPAAISAAMLLVYWPLIFVRADSTYARATGRHVEGFATRWLLITAGLFIASAILFAVRAGVRGRAARQSRRPPGRSRAAGGAHGRR
jgi:hypothetical protein